MPVSQAQIPYSSFFYRADRSRPRSNDIKPADSKTSDIDLTVGIKLTPSNFEILKPQAMAQLKVKVENIEDLTSLNQVIYGILSRIQGKTSSIILYCILNC
jgi:hypothetical protein